MKNIIIHKTNSPIKAALIVLLAIISIIMLWTSISTSGENKRLRIDVKDKLLKIKEIEDEKKAIFESIKKDSIKIAEKDAIILDLKKKEYSLNNTLIHLKNESISIKNVYLSRAVNERVDIFAKLATSDD